ncbi:MAG TPA: restriction endonuclease subunit S [Candidatus Competibacteraceae bacterium]|nr:restriction endonuclease subunit S [Candidatus Competibacteraceae bacterium]HRZ04860.1 restriction endonuclease subunit S [Candidatus Competibacteraceae bacterium]HSA46752.1 restriction endonuclease subunit S [Candidatus Competibacteraceae bacterium]
MKQCLNHGLNGLKDDTDYLHQAESEAIKSVQSDHPCPSVIQTGYKQTEVGVIPEEWEVKRIGDLATIGAGGTPSREISTYWNGSIPWITTSQIDFNTIVEVDQFITEDGLKNSAAKLLPAGTLLMALYGQGKTRGKVGVLGVEATTNQACASISLHGAVSREFLLHFLVSRYQAIRNSSNTGSQENLNGKIVKDIPVLLPPLPEQRAIAAALSDVDALIASLDALIAKKRDLKQATMQQLLTGKQRLPGFSGEWEVRRLGDVAHIKTGGKNNEDKIEDGAYPLFVRSETVERINSYSYDCEAILVPGEGGIGSIFHYINGKFDCHQRVYKISAFNADTSGKFIFYCMKNSFHKQATRHSVKATVDSLRLPTFLEFEFVAPTLEEQTAITTVLSDMDVEINALEARRDKTKLLKQGMMQELLTGRIRLV